MWSSFIGPVVFKETKCKIYIVTEIPPNGSYLDGNGVVVEGCN